MPPIFLAQQVTPKLRGCPTLQKLTEGEKLCIHINKNGLKYNVVSFKSVPALSSVGFWERKGYLFLAAGIRDSFRTEVMFQQDETRNKDRDEADSGPGYSSTG